MWCNMHFIMLVLPALLLRFMMLHMVTPATAVTECERRMHSSFTAQQKQQLCAPLPSDSSSARTPAPRSRVAPIANAVDTGTSIGPAICASVAKDSLHAKFEVILELCRGASSAAPAQCMSLLDNAARNKFGLQLCARSNSTLPGECYASVSKFSGGNHRVKAEELVPFCSGLVDRAPLQCIHAVKNTSLLPVPKALHVCNDSVGNGFTNYNFLNNAVSTCISHMHDKVNPSFGLGAEDILRFCAAINYLPDLRGNVVLAGVDKVTLTEAAECFAESAQLKGAAAQQGGTGPPLLTGKQRLALCENAPAAMGPIDCAADAVQRVARSDPNTRLKGADVVALCHGATGIGPSKCFVESKALGSLDVRTHLCNGATSAGPAQCYRRAGSVFKAAVDPIQGNRTLLCVSAETEDPAYCAAEAPHYLSTPEKVELCSLAPSMAGKDPVKCLAAAEAVYRQFQSAPSKSLGYFLANLWDKQERASRALLLQMCSFGASQDPLAAAECLKSAPKSLLLDDAVRMCTNISSAQVIEHMQLCHRILPRTWQSEESALLCEHTESRIQVEAAVKCAVEAVRASNTGGTNFLGAKENEQQVRIAAAQLCAQEQAEGPVLACVKEIAKIPNSVAGSYLLTPQSVVAACASARDSKPGECMRKLTSIGSSKLTFDASVPAHLCRQQDPLPVIACLEQQGKRLISIDDVDTCVNSEQEIKTIRILKMYTEDNDVEITAGRRFLVWFQVLDQWGRFFRDDLQEYMFSASINANNGQGAVLWGLRSNYTSTAADAPGRLELNSLVISQPGPVEFRLSVRRFPSAASAAADATDPKRTSATPSPEPLRVVQTFRLMVKEDPAVAETAPCMFVFLRAQCPSGTDAADWEAEFPRTRSYSPAADNYMQNILCAGDVLQAWHVNAYLMPGGSMWVEYRMGIDSIWTGIGMPKMEMGPEERLGLFDSYQRHVAAARASSDAADGEKSNKQSKKSRKQERLAQKELRRAYYRKSLQWHPDRWVGLAMYSLAVQGAFELINEAYETLLLSDQESDSATRENGSKEPDVVPVYE